jgi:hypothetical protein
MGNYGDKLENDLITTGRRMQEARNTGKNEAKTKIRRGKSERRQLMNA